MSLKTDLVYVCRPGDNEELRYSIRSVVANLKHNKIWIVGYKPDWYTGDFISVEDTSSKFNNIINCLKVVIDSEDVSENFIFMNDDFFLLKQLDSIPVLHGGLLFDKVEKYMSIISNSYARLLQRTYHELVNSGISDPLDYDIHVPMPMTKSGLRLAITKAYFPRSAYGNIMSIGGELTRDVKAYQKGSYLSSNSYDFENGSLPFISSEDGSFRDVYNLLLKDMFPSPTKYEL